MNTNSLRSIKSWLFAGRVLLFQSGLTGLAELAPLRSNFYNLLEMQRQERILLRRLALFDKFDYFQCFHSNDKIGIIKF